MDHISVFNEQEYRVYMNKKLSSPEFGRSSKSKLAEHLGCQSSFISQVLKGINTFSLEQALKVNVFFSHEILEQDYFMTLVEFDRAGSFDLKKYYEKKLQEIREKSALIQNRIEYHELTDSEIVEYYNSWDHVRIHHLVGIPEFQNYKNLKAKLNISDQDLKERLDFLLEKKLIGINEDGQYYPDAKKLFIPKESTLVDFVHVKARLENILNLPKANKDCLNFGAHLTISKKNYDLFRSRIVDLLEELYSLVEDEDPERFCSIVIDFMDF